LNRYKKSANQKNPAAQNTLGKCYEKGIGVKKNLKQAVFW
jgi:TPR repeat protein